MDGTQRQDRETVVEVAARLPWLAPSAGALERLASEPVPIDELSADPGLVLLALRFVRPSSTPKRFTFRSIRESVVAEAASRLLASPERHWLDTSRGAPARWLATARARSAAARTYAISHDDCYVDAAAAIGLLSPLGELALASIDQGEPVGNAESVARRLVHRWRLPEWVAATLSTQRHTLSDAVRLGADPALARMLREIGPLDQSEARTGPAESPYENRLLPLLLRTVARGRRANNDHRSCVAEAESDRLHELLAEVRDDFEIAVRDAKLSGLAELAAGAGHEINNPLAIISGHVQRLRKVEEDADREKVFDAVLRQTDRISDIVRELMLFARPAPPGRVVLDPARWIAEQIEELDSIAGERGVSLVPTLPDSACRMECDAGQFRKILRNLLRNAIEATPEGGQVRIVLTETNGTVRIAIEDDGPGPRDEAVPHLFDPFFSGRHAGRGRGLGLATAWRLASINGGDLRYHRDPKGPTRFVLEFPAPRTAAPPLRIPA